MKSEYLLRVQDGGGLGNRKRRIFSIFANQKMWGRKMWWINSIFGKSVPWSSIFSQLDKRTWEKTVIIYECLLLRLNVYDLFEDSNEKNTKNHPTNNNSSRRTWCTFFLGLPSSSWKEKEFKKKEKEKSDQGDIDSFLFSNFFFYKCSCLILILD